MSSPRPVSPPADRPGDGAGPAVIAEVQDRAALAACVPVIRAAFRTVADQLGLTESSAPSHPAFLGLDRLLDERSAGTRMFALLEEDRPVGCVAVRQGADGGFHLERLAVLPEQRHRGHGLMLLRFACARIRERGGHVARISIVAGNDVLKRWYAAYGFVETGTRTFPHLPFRVCFMEKRMR